MNSGLTPSENETDDSEQSFPAGTSLVTIWLKTAIAFIKEQTILMEAFFVAVSFHILLFPVVWFVGWALPWPKAPNMTTVIELNLENWPNSASPTKIEELFNTKKNEYGKAH